MDVEVALADTVRDWARANCPGEPSVTSGAVATALNSLAGGASIAEAYEQARTFVASWQHHPAHGGYGSGSQVPLAA